MQNQLMEQPLTAALACGLQGDKYDVTITAGSTSTVVTSFIVYEIHFILCFIARTCDAYVKYKFMNDARQWTKFDTNRSHMSLPKRPPSTHHL